MTIRQNSLQFIAQNWMCFRWVLFFWGGVWSNNDRRLLHFAVGLFSRRPPEADATSCNWFPSNLPFSFTYRSTVDICHIQSDWKVISKWFISNEQHKSIRFLIFVIFICCTTHVTINQIMQINFQKKKNWIFFTYVHYSSNLCIDQSNISLIKRTENRHDRHKQLDISNCT